MTTIAEPIAIIGFANRFPDEADTTEGLWRFLLKARSAFSTYPEDRIGPGHYHPDPNHRGSHAVQGAHFLAEDPALFDAPFFSITKNEVAALDPQQRLVLENVHHALENAGITMPEITGSETSVYVSGFNHDHLLNLSADPEVHLKYRGTGTLNSLLSNRVSWFYDMKGPSMTLDTACSSSMVALHIACQSLRSGESNLSVVSGVMNIGYPSDLVAMSHVGFLGQSGRSYSFDHRAEGYARGEGVGSLIIKRLSDAIRDGNTIRAVIRATGVNQDGRTPGITLPSTEAQVKLIRKVYESAGLDVKDTMMIEAHGTGTAAGDPIEAAAIARSFEARSKEIPIFVGALKSGIGHLEGAAGVASLIKSILVLESGIIPPNVNFEKPNPRIPVSKWNIQFPLEPTPWPTQGLRRISVNSFGVGGTNGHAILDDAHHYLQSQGLDGRHNTRHDVPSAEEVASFVTQAREQDARSIVDSVLDTRVQMRQSVISQTNGTENGHVNGHLNGHADIHSTESTKSDKSLTNGLTNGDIIAKTNGKQNGQTNGTSTGTANGISNGDGTHQNGDTSRNSTPDSAARLVLLSAMDEHGVSRNATRQAHALVGHAGSDTAILDRFAYTMNQRDLFPWRSFAVGGSIQELISSLEKTPQPVRFKSIPSLGLVFTGQGAQWHAMGRELSRYPIYSDSLRRADQYYRSLGAEWSLIEELAQPKQESRLNEPWLAHPACAALQIAAIELLESFGVVPKRVVGHSSGEIAAAFCAAKLTREDAWKVAFYRGIVSAKQLTAKGAMMAVGLSENELMPHIKEVMQEQSGTLTVACFNSPKNCTVSGDEEKVDALQKVLENEQIFARKLQVQNAYHSAHMKEVADEYLALLGTLDKPEHPTRGTVEFFSSLLGQKVDDEVFSATYWVDNLVSPVKFKDAVISMLSSQTGKEQASMRINSASRALAVDLVLEVGPHSTMQSAIKECCATRSDAASVGIFGLLNRRNPTVSGVLGVMGQLCARGFPINLSALNQITPREEPLRLLGLPGYAFNHSERNMHESRLVRNYRTRKQPRHDLLGAPVPDWNEETPRWRHYFSADEQPWIRDHQVTNSIVLPAVAYLCMALEALRQILGPDDKAVAYKLRDVNIKQAMVIADDGDGVEACITLCRVDESSLWSSPTWRRFVITSYNPVADNWIEHCTGYIAVELETTDGPIDQGRDRGETSAAEERALKLSESRCVTTVDVEAMYDNLVTSGIKFGPTFRNLSQIRRTPSNAGEATAHITIPDIAALMPFKFTYPHLIHPSTFDSMLQLFLQALLDLEGRNTLSRPLVPTFMKEVWVTADIVAAPDHHFVGRAKSKLIAYDKYESDVSWYDGASRKACVRMSGIRSTFLDSAESQSMTSRSLCHELRWVPHLESLTPASFPKSGLRSKEDDESYRLQTQRFQTASVLLVLDALDIIGDLSPGTLDGHFQKFYSWMLQIRKWFVDDEITAIKRSEVLEIAKDPIAKQKLLDEVSATNANGQIAVRMGSHIVDVLNKKEEALHLMFGQDDALERLYGELVNLGNIPTLWATYLKTIADNKTNLRILEIGAGTGASTVPILEQLTSVSPEGLLTSSRIKTYTFTDISAGFFEKAKERFSTYRDIMEFKALDAEKDLSEQSFDLGSYDYIIAQNVIHATADLKATLGNVRRLLKPEGFLLLQEGVRQDYFWSPIAFGQLPGWWAAVEPFRQWSPWIPSSQWGEVLRASGFEVELELADSEVSALHTQSIFVCKSVENTKKDRAKFAIVTTQTPDTEYTALVQELKTRVEEMTFPDACHVLHYLDVVNTDIEDTVCIAVMELERPFLANATEQEFDNFKMLLSICKGMLWVSGDPLRNPALDMITGITRVNRWERDIEDANLVTLHVSEDDKSSANLVDSVVRLFQQQFLGNLPIADINGEYMLKGGSMLTSRLVDAIGADDYLLSKFSRPKPVLKTMKDAGRPLKLSVAAPGLLDRLEWVTDEVYEQPLGETEVEVQTLAAGVNFRDLMIAMGEHMASCMGVEASGIVTRVGSGVRSVNIGDRVVYLQTQSGTFQNYGRVDQQFVTQIPDDLDYSTAASLLTVYITVIYGLEDSARLERGEKILIHAAAGGVGQAAIQYAHYMGAEVFATVSTPAKRELLMKEYGIPEDHIFSSRDLTFAQGVMRMTQGKGVDVILNSLSGESLRTSWELLAPFGRFIEIGKKDAQANGKIGLSPYLRNVTMASVEVPTMVKYRPALAGRLIKDVVQLWRDGHIRAPTPITTMSFSEVEAALRTLQSGKGMGKIVLVPSDDDLIPVVPLQPPSYDLSAEASYVIAGGLGGIGRSMATWMAARGAKHIILLSRSGTINDEVAELVATLKIQGCSVHVLKCDVSNKEQVHDVLEKCKSTLPPIKGVIQGAMVLDDVMFENMSYASFQKAILPKVQGSWNLHELLPKDLDFFVMLSSSTGVLGNRSQANYAAGNTYQDMLAQHRRSLGLKSATVDLGAVLAVGYIAKNRQKFRSARHLGTVLEALREDEVQALIEYCMSGRTNAPAQLVTGLSSIMAFNERGLPLPTYMEYPLFTNLRTVSLASSGRTDSSDSVSVETLLSGAGNLEEAAEVVQTAIVNKLSALLSVPADTVDSQRSVASAGVDSLIAMEFRAFLAKEVKADVPVLDIMGTMSLAALSVKVAGLSLAVSFEETKADAKTAT